jgi:hypothetical protein
MILTLVFFSAQVLDMSSPGNPMAWIMSVGPLTGANYLQWRDKINMSLALFEIDKAITDKRPVEPILLDIPNDLGADAKAEREKQNSKPMSCYEIDKINWERSNRKCLMVIKERISEGIRGQSRIVRLMSSTWRKWRVSSLALRKHMPALSSRGSFLRSTPVEVCEIIFSK